MMGQSKLIWSSIQLRLAKQHRIVPIGRLIWVSVIINGVHNVPDFEVIEIVNGSTPYPTLLGIYWAFENETIIDLKKRQMIFQVEELKFVASLDPTEGRRYVELVKGK
jgi:hypothetical protein